MTAWIRRRHFDVTSIVAIAVALAAAAAGVGTGVLVTDTDPPRVERAAVPVTVRVGAFELVLPEGWSKLKRAPRLAGLSGPGAIAVRGDVSDVLISRRRLEGPLLLPRAFVKSLSNPLPKPEQVLVGERRAYHYGPLFGLQRDVRVDIFALPTTSGVVTIACVADTASVQSSEDCVTALGGLQLGDVAAVQAAPGVAVSLTLRRTVTRLNATRLPVRRRLAASRYPTPRRKAAEQLARAHDRAAADLAVMADTAADRAIIGSLRGVAAAYRSYASASARRDVRGARAAAQRLRTGERELARRLAARRAFRLDAT